MFMHDLGYREVDITPTYDDKTAKAIKAGATKAPHPC